MVPHNHMIIAADSITASTMAIFRDLVRSYHGQVWNPDKRRYEEPRWKESIRFAPTTQTFLINELEDRANILDYLVKPFDLVTPYRAAWEIVKTNDRENAILLNQNVAEVLTNWEVFTKDRDGHYYRGAMHHRSGTFLGVQKRLRETPEHEQHVQALLAEVADQNFAWCPSDGRIPIEREGPPELGAGGTL